MPPEVKHLSPSKIQTAVEKCMLRMKFELELREAGIPLPSTWFMLGGRAVHKDIEWGLNEVISGRKLPSGTDMTDRFGEFFDREVAREKQNKNPIQEDTNETPEKVQNECRELMPIVRAFLLNLKPKHVEYTAKPVVENDGDPFIIWMVMDYIDQSNGILDWKLKVDKVAENAKKRDLQMDAYGWWAMQEYGVSYARVSKIFLIRGKHPRIERQDYDIQPHHGEFFIEAAKSVWAATRKGIYVPNTSSFWCSERFCPFWSTCRGGQ